MFVVYTVRCNGLVNFTVLFGTCSEYKISYKFPICIVEESWNQHPIETEKYSHKQCRTLQPQNCCDAARTHNSQNILATPPQESRMNNTIQTKPTPPRNKCADREILLPPSTRRAPARPEPISPPRFQFCCRCTRLRVRSGRDGYTACTHINIQYKE